MNPWALDKHDSIKVMLVALGSMPGTEHVEMDDPASLHARAIRLRDTMHTQSTAYVYSYGQQPGHYGVDLEYPPASRVEAGYIETLEAINLQRLIEILCVHFEIVGEQRGM